VEQRKAFNRKHREKSREARKEKQWQTA